MKTLRPFIGFSVSFLIFSHSLRAAEFESCSGSTQSSKKQYSVTLAFDWRSRLSNTKLEEDFGFDLERNLPSVAQGLFGIPQSNQIKISERDLILSRYRSPSARVTAFADCISGDDFTKTYDPKPNQLHALPFLVGCMSSRLPKSDQAAMKELGLVSDRSNCEMPDCRVELRKGLSKFLPKPDFDAPSAVLARIQKERSQVEAKGGTLTLAAYAGHGSQCKLPDGSLDFCMLIIDFYSDLFDEAPRSAIGLEVMDDKGLVPVRSDDRKSQGIDYILGKKWLAATKSRHQLIDACLSGELVATVDQDQGLRNQLMILSDALPQQTATPVHGEGGKLLTFLRKLAEAPSSEVCDLDLDGDGSLSERELAAVFLAHLSGISGMVGQLGLEATRSRVSSEASSPPTLAERLIGDELPSAMASGRCVAKLPKASCKRRPEVGATACEKYQKSTSRILAGLERLFDQKNPLPIMKTVKAPPKTDSRSEEQRARIPTHIVRDQNRRFATKFLRDWIVDLKSNQPVCGGSTQAACQREEADRSLRYLEGWVSELTDMLQFMERDGAPQELK